MVSLGGFEMSNTKLVRYIPRNYDWGEWKDWDIHVKPEIKRYQTCQSVSVGLNRDEELVGWIIEWV